MRSRIELVAAACAVALSAGAASAALYSENFEVDPTASWTVNNNNLGTNAANFFFDYSTVGIPSAPNSGGTTRGLKIGANLNPGTAPTVAAQIPGISVSPTGQTFSGDYVMRFDWWSNYIGPLAAGATGSTMVSTFGMLTSGTVVNSVGAADGVFFAATGDGQSATDYRAYSSERTVSYQIPPTAAEDAHAVYLAGSRNSSAALYTTLFPAGQAAPASQLSAFPTQSGATSAGAAGFRWVDVEITKVGNIVTWEMNGVPIATVDTTLFTVPTGGTNILFGHADTNNTTNASAALLEALQFTLIDNVRVDVVPEPSSLAVCGLGALALVRRRRA